MFKVFVMVFDTLKKDWVVKKTEVVTSAADSRSAVRRLRREFKGQRPLVSAYPANQVPAYIPL